jgi:hypothetical protein
MVLHFSLFSASLHLFSCYSIARNGLASSDVAMVTSEKTLTNYYIPTVTRVIAFIILASRHGDQPVKICYVLPYLA